MIVDSFAGGGGASLGVEMATGRSPDIAINQLQRAARRAEGRGMKGNVMQRGAAVVSDQSDCPAFPVSTLIGGHQDSERTWQFPGLTKRELFAAMAMQGLLAGSGEQPFHSEDGKPATTMADNYRYGAHLAVSYADALIAALNAEPQS